MDQGQVDKLRDMITGDDYKEKLGGIVSQLYKLAFQTYHDIPRGPIKVCGLPRWPQTGQDGKYENYFTTLVASA